MIQLDIEFSGMIAFDLRKNPKNEKIALLLAGEGTAPHLPVVAIPRSAVAKDGIPTGFRQPPGWPQGLDHGGSEQLLFGLKDFDLRVSGAGSKKTATFKKVWNLVTLNQKSGGKGNVQCGAEVGRVVMSGGLLTEGKAYPPFNRQTFALKRAGKILSGTTKKLTNSMRWSGASASVRVFRGGEDCGPIGFKDSGSKVTKVRIAVYSLTAGADVDKDSLGDFLNFYSLLSPPPAEAAGLVEYPPPPEVRVDGFPRCIPPVMIL